MFLVLARKGGNVFHAFNGDKLPLMNSQYSADCCHLGGNPGDSSAAANTNVLDVKKREGGSTSKSEKWNHGALSGAA